MSAYPPRLQLTWRWTECSCHVCIRSGWHDVDSIHDSNGFEAGSEHELQLAVSFINDRAKKEDLSERLHMIW